MAKSFIFPGSAARHNSSSPVGALTSVGVLMNAIITPRNGKHSPYVVAVVGIHGLFNQTPDVYSGGLVGLRIGVGVRAPVGPVAVAGEVALQFAMLSNLGGEGSSRVGAYWPVTIGLTFNPDQADIGCGSRLRTSPRGRGFSLKLILSNLAGVEDSAGPSLADTLGVILLGSDTGPRPAEILGKMTALTTRLARSIGWVAYDCAIGALIPIRSDPARTTAAVQPPVAIAVSNTYSALMTRPAASHEVRFSISNLQAWAPGVTSPAEWHEWARGDRPLERTGEPPLQQMAPMLRRHAGRLGRLACSPAYDTLGSLRDIPMVFSARYGEVSRSVELLTALSAGEELSPTSFGLSVHNAVPGLFSMARKEMANSISLAAGDDSAEFGVIEACGLLADGAEQVLLVVADCPLPAIYEKFEDAEPAAFGWSCLVIPPQYDPVTLSWSDTAQMVRTTGVIGPLAALAVLLGESREVFRRTLRFGQNDDSDPTRLSPPHPPKSRTWHWSRNA